MAIKRADIWLPTKDATITPATVESGYTGYAKGQKITGILARRPYIKNAAYAQAVTCSITCTVGDLIIVGIVKRDALSTPSGWTLLHTDAGISSAQWLSVLYKTATSTTEAFTTTTGSSTRIYIGMFAMGQVTAVTYLSESTPETQNFSVNRSSTEFHLWFCQAYSAAASLFTVTAPATNNYERQVGLLRADAANSRLGIIVDGDPSHTALTNAFSPGADVRITSVKVT